jgi:uncharacterized Zn-finger protein
MVRGISRCRMLLIASARRCHQGENMSDHVVPHFHNDAGVSVIEIGSQEFMCVGANPPFDHPHVFLDLGNDNEIARRSIASRPTSPPAKRGRRNAC